MKFTQISILSAALILVGWFLWQTGNTDEAVNTSEDVAQMNADALVEEIDASKNDSGGAMQEETNIVVNAPQPGSMVTSPVTITGRARVFENTVNVAFRDAAGNTKIQEVAIAKAAAIGEFGEFSITITYNFNATKKGMIEVFSLSPKDGSEIDTVVIPVAFE
ncbi:MAG: hypothetical protein COT39_01860 [Parcubacteria group bacterium CG08_land_8_20_14_0_20_48_21]|nr:MAG: hypothetical protein AUK21_03155 [Parcubacteria group bacterium CG2_30_48_51]PIS32925.1 MAG: hypothetical protein COT39_01860 [Parcubacteria group bacterium CG08_land_8_20_14_0_20_48_21]PIW79178.1 MAG: hypothetical protein COZ99_02755 [Parcubacteria group bacterium CG_4_8_14_3_um_filter_48_16]PIY77825.1 MAG: hypothetical protein COY83_03415 [Parcubacteria group bacterium CG_4_10_14_0_8_um_filter_48_154]PIZ77961.1 MAG: hypothetical protein COY03_00690 [bacterium CG_4_10_14_0_2_um_filter_